VKALRNFLHEECCSSSAQVSSSTANPRRALLQDLEDSDDVQEDQTAQRANAAREGLVTPNNQKKAIDPNKKFLKNYSS
jgi:hypothetical protein